MEPDSPYLQVDFGENILVCAIETRGYDDNGEELYAQEFKLSFEADGENSFTEYMEDGEIRVRSHFGYLSASSSLLWHVVSAHTWSVCSVVIGRGVGSSYHEVDLEDQWCFIWAFELDDMNNNGDKLHVEEFKLSF